MCLLRYLYILTYIYDTISYILTFSDTKEVDDRFLEKLHVYKNITIFDTLNKETNKKTHKVNHLGCVCMGARVAMAPTNF